MAPDLLNRRRSGKTGIATLLDRTTFAEVATLAASDEVQDAILNRYNTHAALVAERNAYRKSLEQAVVWARAKCERIGVAEEAWLEDARTLLRGDAK